MKKRLLLITLLSLGLVGCGTNPSNPQKDPKQSEEQPGEKQPEEKQPEVVKEYSVTFYDIDGNVLESKKYKEGEIPSKTYVIPDTPKYDYTFKGWNVEKDQEIALDLPKVTADASYYPAYVKQLIEYTITFDVVGAEKEILPIKGNYEDEIAEPEKPVKDGYKFICWLDSNENEIVWPYTLIENKTFHAKWEEKLDIKSLVNALLDSQTQDPYSFIPQTMRPGYEANFVDSSDIPTDFSTFVNLSEIKYGHGEQWSMVLDNIQQSENFYNVLNKGDGAFSTAASAIREFYLLFPDSEIAEKDTENFKYSVNYKVGSLTIDIELKKSLSLPLIGEVRPIISMVYDIKNQEKTVKIHLSDTNVLKYTSSANKYQFAIEYGVSAINRKAYFSVEKDQNGNVSGKIFEYISSDTVLQGKQIASKAEFVSDGTYMSVVGNKADAIIGFTGYINELYQLSSGSLIGYEVEEIRDLPKVPDLEYHTLWFKLNDISGISNIKMVQNGNLGQNDNAHDVYLNNFTAKFSVVKNTYLMIIPTSRKFDIEMRKMYFYNLVDEQIVRSEVLVPMMFIQEQNIETYSEDILKSNQINSTIKTSSAHLTKIEEDHAGLIKQLKDDKDIYTVELIAEYLA